MALESKKTSGDAEREEKKRKKIKHDSLMKKLSRCDFEKLQIM